VVLAQTDKNAPDFGDFSARNPEKCYRRLAPDNLASLALPRPTVCTISHKPKNQTGNCPPWQMPTAKPFIKMTKDVLLLIYEGILTPTLPRPMRS
jgi:hypothetical protein